MHGSQNMGDANCLNSCGAISMRGRILLLATITFFMGMGAWANYHGVYRQDQYQLINLGQVIHDGGTLYVDCWENKPPGVAWIVATILWMTGGSQLSVWIFPCLLGIVGISLLAWSAARFYGATVGVIISILASTKFSLRAFDAPSNHPDFYSAMFALIGTAVFLVVPQAGRSSAWMGIVAGAAWGCSVLCRQTGLTGPIILSAVVLLFTMRDSAEQASYRRTMKFAAASVAIMVGAAVGLLSLQGSLKEAHAAIFTFNQGLLSVEHWTLAAGSAGKLLPVLVPFGVPFILALFSVVFALRDESGTLDRRLVLGLAAWFATDNWLSLLGPSQIDRYWMATWTPLLFLAADGLYLVGYKLKAYDDVTRRRLTVVAALAACGLSYPLAMRHIHGRYQDGLLCSFTHYLTGKTLLSERGVLRAHAQRIENLVPIDHTIYILKYDPGIYLYAGRSCAARFTYPRGTEQQDEVLDTLAERPPKLILMPVDTDPGAEWQMSEERVLRLYHIMIGFEDLGSFLGYQYFLKSDQPVGL